MQTRAQNKQKKGLSKKKGKSAALHVRHGRTIVHRRLFESELDVFIPFYRAQSNHSASQTFAAYTMKVNTLADSSNTYIAVAEFTGFYKRYRVVNYNFSVQITNGSALSMAASTCLTNNSTAVSSYATTYSNGVNPGGQLSLLSLGTGGSDKATHRYRGSVAAFEGSVEPETSDSFAASTSAVADPANLLYLQLAATNSVNASSQFFIDFLISGTLLVRFFDANSQYT